MSEIEREVKLLNINLKEVLERLNRLGIKPKWKGIQEVYTFDFHKILNKLESQINNFKVTGDKRAILSTVKEIDLCLTNCEKAKIKELLNKENLVTYVKENDNLSKFNEKEIQDIILKSSDRLKKWIRLRKTGDETTITIKRIIKSNEEYEIDNVEELEIPINDIEAGKELLANLGFFPTNYQKKLRISYDYNNTEIVLDKWPKIPPYIEIEGGSKEDIFQTVKDLGYKENDIKIMNTDTVYKLNGINLYDFKELDFDDKEKELVDLLLNFNYKESKKKNFVIAVSGMSAAGKTSVCKELTATIPNLVYLDFGAFFRPIALHLINKEGMTIEDLNNIIKKGKLDKLINELNIGYRVDENKEYKFSIDGNFFENEELYNLEMDKLTVDVGTCFGDNLNRYIREVIEDIREKNPVLLNARRPFSVCKDISNHIFLKAEFDARAERKARIDNISIEESKEKLKIRDGKEINAGFWDRYDFTKVIDTTNNEVKDTANLIKEHILSYTIKNDNKEIKEKENYR